MVILSLTFKCLVESLYLRLPITATSQVQRFHCRVSNFSGICFLSAGMHAALRSHHRGHASFMPCPWCTHSAQCNGQNMSVTRFRKSVTHTTVYPQYHLLSTFQLSFINIILSFPHWMTTVPQVLCFQKGLQSARQCPKPLQ